MRNDQASVVGLPGESALVDDSDAVGSDTVVPGTINQISRTCRHCGATLGRNQREFCCIGCQMVAATLETIGATEFYHFRDLSVSGDGHRPTITNQTFAYMDNPDFQAEHVSFQGQSAMVTLQLQGVHCAGCIWLLESLPKFLPGVLNCRAQLSSGTVVVTFDPALIHLSQIAQFIESIGYTPHLFTATSAMTVKRREFRSLLTRLGVAAFCTGNIMLVVVPLYQGAASGIDDRFYNLFRFGNFILFLPALLYSAVPFFRNAWGGLKVGQLHLDFPIALSLVLGTGFSIWNLLLGEGDLFFDSLAMLIFLLLAGRYWLSRTLFRVRERTHLAAHCLPIWARIKDEKGSLEVPLSVLKVGDLIEVRAGEILPADGVVYAGHSMLNNSILTGEPLPVEVEEGANVFAGALNTDSPILIKVSAWGSMSRFGKVVDDLTKEVDNVEVSELIDRAARYFSVIIVLASIGAFVFYLPQGLGLSIDRAMAISVIACPCALGLATPATVAFSIARLASRGVFVRGAATLERLTRVREIHLDKTGTLTLPTLAVSHVEVLDTDYKSEIAGVVIRLCRVTPFHPVAQALTEYFSALPEGETLPEGATLVHPGRGISYECGEVLWRLGSLKWLRGANDVAFLEGVNDTLALLTRNDKLIACFRLTNQLHPSSISFVRWLASVPYGIKILSGDRKEAVDHIGRLLGVPSEDVFGELYPEEKEALIKKAARPGLMVGDGMNDSSAIRAADIGIVLGGGVEFLLDRADIVIQSHDPLLVKDIMVKARRVYRTIQRGLIISLAYNLVGVVLAGLGYIDALGAAFLMPLSSSGVIVHAYWSSKRL